MVIDERATEPQRGALLRILTGLDTEPGATVFNVFASTFEKLHDPIFAPIDFQVDVAGRKARLVVPGVTEGRGEPILNPVTGAQHRVRIMRLREMLPCPSDARHAQQHAPPGLRRAPQLWFLCRFLLACAV